MVPVDIMKVTISGTVKSMGPPVTDGMMIGKTATTARIMMNTSPKRNGKSTGKSARIMKSEALIFGE